MALRRLSEAARRLLAAHALRELARCMLTRSRVSCPVAVACPQATVDALHATRCAVPSASAERLGQLATAQGHAGPSSANAKEIWLEQACVGGGIGAEPVALRVARYPARLGELITKQV